MRWQSLSLVFLFALTALASAQSAKVLKVLPQFLDEKGRSSLNPSLYERDAYQAHLRSEPTKRSALQFKINWKAKGFDQLTLRIEAKGGQPRRPKMITLEEKVKPGTLSRWSALTISGDEYKQFGEMIAWRATMWNGTNQVAEQKSFLW